MEAGGERYSEGLADRRFVVEDWTVMPTLNRITRERQTIQVEPKVMQVLVCLAEHAGHVVTRDDLMDTVWADTVVGDDLLTRSISELRKIFDDDPRNPAVIETIRTRGYRLIASVSLEEEAPDTLPQVRTTERVRLLTTGLVLLIVLAIGGFAGYQLLNESSTQPMRVTPLTSFPGEERSPTFSPDGHQVAFIWDNGTDDGYDLYTLLVGTGQPLQLTDTPADERSPAWSPDGTHIAFVRRSADACGIFVVPALGGSARRLAACEIDVDGLAWSPDGQWLALSERDRADAPFRIALLSVETRERRTLTAPPAPYRGDRAPVFSPDGRTVAFARDLNGWVAHLYLIAFDGTGLRQLTTANRDIVGLDWATDGHSLVFSSNIGGEYSLWRISRSGGMAERVPASGLRLKRPTLSRHGAALAYESWIYNIDVWRAPLRAGASPATPKRVASSTMWDVHPHVAPDGRHLAFVSTRSGAFEVWMSDADGTNPVQVTQFGGTFTGTPRWSPDGRQLVFDARPDGYADLYVVHVNDRTPHRLTQGSTNNVLPRWSRDGQWIYFASDRTGQWEVWRLPSAGGEPVQVTRQGGYAAQEAPNGAAIYYTKRGHPGLWRTTPDENVETRVLDTLAPYDWGNWTVRADGVYFLQRSDDGRATLARFDLDTRRTTPVATLDGHPGSPGISLSPDGQWVYYTHIDHRDSDLMLIEHFQ